MPKQRNWVRWLRGGTTVSLGILSEVRLIGLADEAVSERPPMGGLSDTKHPEARQNHYSQAAICLGLGRHQS